MSVVLKWDVQVNDLVQFIGAGPVLMVAAQYDNEHVQVWTLESEDAGLWRKDRAVRVIGTGHPTPVGHYTHIGSALAPPFVWHVFACPAHLVPSPASVKGETP